MMAAGSHGAEGFRGLVGDREPKIDSEKFK